MSDEILAIDLDDEIIFHMALPESVTFLRTEDLSTDLIFDDFAREVYGFQMNHVKEHGIAATPEVLCDEFDGFNDTPILELYDPVTAVGDLLMRLRERFVRYTGKGIVSDLADLCIEHPLEVANRLLVEGRKLSTLVTGKGEVYGTGDFDRAWDGYEALAEQGQGPSLGYDEIDEHFAGMLGLTYLVATRKSYKSWITLNTVLQNVMQGKKCKLYPLELPAFETYWRFICLASDIPYWKFHKRALMPTDRAHMKETIEFIDDHGLFQIEKPDTRARGVQRMMESALNDGMDAVFIDQLQYVENQKGYTVGSQNDTGVYWEVCDDFRNYSDKVPIGSSINSIDPSCITWTNFPAHSKERARLAIEETATLELGLWCNKPMRTAGALQIGTLESRNHDHKHWHLQVDLSHGCSFTMIGEYEEPEEDDGD